MDRIRAEFGMLCAVVANANPFGGGDAKQPSDFYPDDRKETQRQSAEEQEALLKAFFGRFKKKT